MFYAMADERRIREKAELEIMRDRHRGPKRDINKITRILIHILRNNYVYPALTTKQIIASLPEINENDLEDYLKFLTAFPSEDKPFLKVEKVHEFNAENKKRPGAPHNEYRFNHEYLEETHHVGYQVDVIIQP